jgi:two-component system, response regulator PdtaR
MRSHTGEARGLAGRSVLVAEDDPFIAAELQDLLSLEGANILGPVPTVRAAMALIESETPDAAVLDVNLRDATSGPIAEALWAAAVPVVLVTGYTRDLLDNATLRDAPILPKPLSWPELRSLLDDLLAADVSDPPDRE